MGSLYLSWVKNLEYRSEILLSFQEVEKETAFSLRQWEVAEIITETTSLIHFAETCYH